MLEASVSHVSHGQSIDSMHRETPLLDRETKEREGTVISVAESMSKKSRRNSIRSHSLQDTENYILMNEISEKTWNEELNKPFLV